MPQFYQIFVHHLLRFSTETVTFYHNQYVFVAVFRAASINWWLFGHFIKHLLFQIIVVARGVGISARRQSSSSGASGEASLASS